MKRFVYAVTTVFIIIIFVSSNTFVRAAEIDDILKKQNKAKQGEIDAKEESKKKSKAAYARSLEYFDIVSSVVEELQKKGMEFESIKTHDCFNDQGCYCSISSKCYRWDAEDYRPILAEKLNYKVIMLGDYNIFSHELFDSYVISIEPAHKTEIGYGTIEMSTFYGDDLLRVDFGIGSRKFSLYDDKAVIKNKDKIRKEIMEMIKRNFK